MEGQVMTHRWVLTHRDRVGKASVIVWSVKYKARQKTWLVLFFSVKEALKVDLQIKVG